MPKYSHEKVLNYNAVFQQKMISTFLPGDFIGV